MVTSTGTFEFYAKTGWMTVGKPWGSAYRGVVWRGELYEAGQCVYVNSTTSPRSQIVVMSTVELAPRLGDQAQFLPHLVGLRTHFAVDVDNECDDEEEILLGDETAEGQFSFELVTQRERPRLLTLSQFESVELNEHCYLVQARYNSKTKQRLDLSEDQIQSTIAGGVQAQSNLSWLFETNVTMSILPLFKSETSPKTAADLAEVLNKSRKYLNKELGALERRARSSKPSLDDYKKAIKIACESASGSKSHD